MKSITPFVLIVCAVVLFFSVADPNYKQIVVLREKQKQYEDALNKSKELLDKQKALQDKYNSFKREDLDKLNLMLPNTIDNIKLLIEMTEIAQNRGLKLTSISLDDLKKDDGAKSGSTATKNPSTTTTSSSAPSSADAKVNSVTMGFSFSADYDTCLQFLSDLQGNLRLADIVNIGVKPSATGPYTFDIKLKTYWLK